MNMVSVIKYGKDNLYIPPRILDIINASLNVRPIGLAGPSGVAKTSLARAVLANNGYEVYQQDVGGLLDPVSIEGTVVLINGHTELKPSPFLQALLAAREGKKVGIVLDEINRGHPSVLNKLFRALAQGEFYSDWYGLLSTSNIPIISTANSGVEYTVSKLDKAIKERHLWIYIPRPEAAILATIIKERVPSISDVDIGFITSLYNADANLVSVREALDLAHLLAKGIPRPDAVEYTFKGSAYVGNLPLESVDGLVAAAKAYR
jgi:MoxR-like ATPase